MGWLDQKIVELQQQIDDLKAREAAIQSDPMKMLATALHAGMTHADHTEGCTWAYEKWENVDPVGNAMHMQYFRMAERLRSTIHHIKTYGNVTPDESSAEEIMTALWPGWQQRALQWL